MSPTPTIRVALLATSVDFGGIERVVLGLVEHMDPTVELVPIVFTRTDTDPGPFFDRLRARGAACERLLVNVWKPTAVLNPLVNLWQAAVLLRRGRFDLIHAHGYRADVFAYALSKLLRIPTVSTCHGFVNNDAKLTFYNALDHRVLRSFDRVIAVSSKMKQDLLGQGLRDDRVKVVTNAVAPVSADLLRQMRASTRAGLGLNDDETVIGFVGRLSEEKGAGYLVEAAGRLHRAGRRIRVLLVGDGPQRQATESLAARHGVTAAVVFTGFQSDTSALYAAMDVFVLPSLTEGTPMALLEAMSHGVPVVASAVGGVPAVVTHRENGYLVPAGNAVALADQLAELMDASEATAQVAQRGRGDVTARFGVKDWIERTVSVYREAATARA